MQIITITVEERDDQTRRVGYNVSDGLTPEDAEAACRFVAEQFRQAAMEAEVQRRVAAAQGAAEDTGKDG